MFSFSNAGIKTSE